jgi:hypothetical protein
LQGVLRKAVFFTWFLDGKTVVNAWQIMVICHAFFGFEKSATFLNFIFGA